MLKDNWYALALIASNFFITEIDYNFEDKHGFSR